MALIWTDFLNGDVLGDIRDKINRFNNEVKEAVNTSTTTIVENTAAINQMGENYDVQFGELNRQLNMDTSKLGVSIDNIKETGNYEVDTDLPDGASIGEVYVVYDTSLPTRVIQRYSNVATGYEAVREFNGDVWSLWNIIKEDKYLYEFAKVLDFSTTADTYQTVTSVSAIGAPQGVYSCKINTTYNYSTTTNGVYFRISVDNGVTWTEYAIEPKNTLGDVPLTYEYIVEHTGGDVVMIVEARSSVNGDTLAIKYCDVAIERKA